MNLSIFLFEYKHFVRSKAKLLSYIFFMIICMFSIFNGFEIMHKHIDTIAEINSKEQSEVSKVFKLFDDGVKGPEDKSWINIEDPYWSIRYTPSYIVKNPSSMMPLGIGQSEQFGFYKKVTRWSSIYDTDMVEEITNYERLINGNIDFSFLIIFLLPILMIILFYNINGLENDLKFAKLIAIQNPRVSFWIFNRLLFYTCLVLFSINILIFSVGLFNGGFSNIVAIFKLILISNLYILFFACVFFYLNTKGANSRNIAFKMICTWLLFCAIIPGSTHQFVSFKYPVNYMTDFLDVNRKQAYEIFKLDNLDIEDILLEIYPELAIIEVLNKKTVDEKTLRRSISAIIDQMNINAANEIEMQNQKKNDLIRLSYFFNPVSYVQNMWNSTTSTDYNSYRGFRKEIQQAISERNKLLVLEMWRKNKVDKKTYIKYLEVLTNK